MSDNPLKPRRDWMDWVQTCSQAYIAFSLFVATQGQNARHARSTPRGVQRRAQKARTDAQWHGSTEESRQKALAITKARQERHEAAKRLLARAERSLSNLYDSVLMHREMSDAEFRRSTDEGGESYLYSAAEAASLHQLRTFCSTLTADQQSDFWAWQRFMSARHYMRQLRAIAAKNQSRAQKMIRRRSLTNTLKLVAGVGALIPTGFLTAYLLTTIKDNVEILGVGIAALIAFGVSMAVLFIPLFLLVRAAFRADTSPVILVSKLDAMAEMAGGPEETTRLPEVARQIAWLTAEGFLPPSSEPGNLDTGTVRKRMQEEAARWIRKPIMRGYVAARRAYYRDLSPTRERREPAKGVESFAARTSTDESDRVLEVGIPIQDAKYLPPGPERDMALKHAEAFRNRHRR